MKVLINLEDFSEEIREKMAKETNDPELLDVLAKDQSEKVLCAVAENPYTKQDILEQFAKEGSHSVKCSVAGNVKIKRSIIDLLFNYGIQLDDADGILFLIATRNYVEPHRDLLIKLASHQNPKVRHSLSWWGIQKIRDDEEILGIILETSYTEGVINSVIDYHANPLVTNEVTRGHIAQMTKDPKKLERLSTDICSHVRYYVVQNQSTSQETLERMKEELKTQIKKYATSEPNKWEIECGYGSLHDNLRRLMLAIEKRIN